MWRDCFSTSNADRLFSGTISLTGKEEICHRATLLGATHIMGRSELHITLSPRDVEADSGPATRQPVLTFYLADWGCSHRHTALAVHYDDDAIRVISHCTMRGASRGARASRLRGLSRSIDMVVGL